jgi:chromosome partitioning protein
VAAEHVLVPVSCEYLPMLGLKLLGDTLAKVRDEVGGRTQVLGYALTMVDRRERITQEVETILRRTFGKAVFDATIRINTHHKASPSHGQTIFEYEARGGRGRRDFETLCEEVTRRLGLQARASVRPQNGRGASPP